MKIQLSPHAPANPVVSFVTVDWHMPHLIRHVMEGVRDAKLPFPYEFFLIDNDSKDGAIAYAHEHFPWAHTADMEYNSGFGTANNVGMTMAKGKYILLVNPDLTIFQGEIEKWIAWMEAHPEVAISGPRVQNPDGSEQDSCYRFPSLMIPLYRRTPLGKMPFAKKRIDRYLMKDMDRNADHEVDWVLGAAMCIRRDILPLIGGGFDESFFAYFEDADLCRRAWAAGKKVMYTPSAHFTHYHRRQSRIQQPWEIFTNHVARIHIQSGIKYFLKYFRKPSPRT